jgi:hypothetical protein
MTRAAGKGVDGANNFFYPYIRPGTKFSIPNILIQN